MWRCMDSKNEGRYLIALESEKKLEAPTVRLIAADYLKRHPSAQYHVKWIEFKEQRSAAIETARHQSVSQFLLLLPRVAVAHCTIHLKLGLQAAKVLWGKSSTLRRHQSNSNTLRNTIAEHIVEHGFAVNVRVDT